MLNLSLVFWVSFHSICNQDVFKHLQEKERERRRGGGWGNRGDPRFQYKLSGFFSEDISNHPLGVYTVNGSFREKVIFDEIM